MAIAKGDDSKPEIIPNQAEVVRKIYDLFLSGTPVRGIQEYLNANSVPNINGEVKMGAERHRQHTYE